MGNKPLILIPLSMATGASLSDQLDQPKRIAAQKEAYLYLRDTYGHWIEQAGGIPLFLGNLSSTHISSIPYHGLLIPGGDDIPTSQHPDHDTFYEHEKVIELGMALLQFSIKAQKPVLGICYGFQLMNVEGGGTLYNTLDAPYKNHRRTTHKLLLEDIPPFLQHATLPKTVNSFHHQGIKTLASSLRTFATSEDGLIEGIYHPQHPFYLGVQWHPELLESDGIITTFIKMCKNSKQRSP